MCLGQYVYVPERFILEFLTTAFFVLVATNPFTSVTTNLQ